MTKNILLFLIIAALVYGQAHSRGGVNAGKVR